MAGGSMHKRVRSGWLRWQTKQCFSDQEQQHGDEERPPDLGGERIIGGAGGLFEEMITGALQDGIQVFVGQGIRLVFGGGAVEREQAFSKAVHTSLQSWRGMGGCAIVIQAGYGFALARAG